MEAKVNDWPQSELRYSLFTNSQYLPPAPEYSVLDYSQPFYDMPITPTNSLTSHAMPSLLWSSIRTTQAPFAELRIPPSTISTPISPPSTPSSRKVIAGRSRPRRMLSGEDRRKMCLYKEENPSMRQRDIAGMTANALNDIDMRSIARNRIIWGRSKVYTSRWMSCCEYYSNITSLARFPKPCA